MIGRIVPYSEVFIAVTLTLDEAAAIADVLGNLRGQKEEVLSKPVKELQATLEHNLDRAAAYLASKGAVK